MTTTIKGDELAGKLNPAIGTTHDIRVTCARICRNAQTLHRLNEAECNGTPYREFQSYYPPRNGHGWSERGTATYQERQRSRNAYYDRLAEDDETATERKAGRTRARLESLAMDLPET